MRLAFAQAHASLAQADNEGKSDSSFSGVSALAVIVRGGLLIAAHTGLCRAVVGHALPAALASRTAQLALSRSDVRAAAAEGAHAASRPLFPGEVSPLRDGEAQVWERQGSQDLAPFDGFPRLPSELRRVVRESDLGEWDAASIAAAGSGSVQSRTSATPLTASARSGRHASSASALVLPESGSPSRASRPVAGTGHEASRPGSSASSTGAAARSRVAEATGGSLEAGTRLAAAPLTLDHRPDRPDEMVRVQALGARVEYFRYADGTLGQLPRLFADQAEGPGLPLSRGIGFCDPMAAKAGVIPEPEVSMRKLTRADRFVIIGSDGLWASLGAAEAVAVVEQVAGSVMWGGSVGAAEGLGGAEAREAAETAAAASGPGGRPRLPPLSDASTAVEVATAPIGGESVAWAAADGGPITGMGGGAAAGAVPARGCSDAREGAPGTGAWLTADWDLAELLLPEPVRLARQLRLRRLAAAAAEALCAASLENDRMRRDRRGRRDDVTAVVLWLDHPPKAQ